MASGKLMDPLPLDLAWLKSESKYKYNTKVPGPQDQISVKSMYKHKHYILIKCNYNVFCKNDGHFVQTSLRTLKQVIIQRTHTWCPLGMRKTVKNDFSWFQGVCNCQILKESNHPRKMTKIFCNLQWDIYSTSIVCKHHNCTVDVKALNTKPI